MILLSVGVGAASASHGGDANEDETVQLATISQGDAGQVIVEITYHVGAETDALAVQLDADTVRETQGFILSEQQEATADETQYKWDGQTQRPTVTYEYQLSSSDAYTIQETWAVVPAPRRLTAQASVVVAGGGLDRRVHLRQGVYTDELTYLGEFNQFNFSAETEEFNIVVSEAADPALTHQEIERRLTTASNALEVGGTSSRVTMFIVDRTSALENAGIAIGDSAWVKENTSLSPETNAAGETLLHEYVHTRQEYQVTPSTYWTIEGSATYYEQLLAFKLGLIDYQRFMQGFVRGSQYQEVSLNQPETWNLLSDYEAGSYAVRAMDSQLRRNGSTYENVFRELNKASGRIEDAELEAIAQQFGISNEFFDEYVRSPPPDTSFPDPSRYTTVMTGANLTIDGPAVKLDPGRTTKIELTVTNHGNQTSIAPQIFPTPSNGVNVSVRRVGRAYQTTYGEHVVEAIPPGESRSVSVEVSLAEEASVDEQIAFRVEDLSDQWTETTIPVESKPLTINVEADPGVTAEGETINVNVFSSVSTAVTRYKYQITGAGNSRAIQSEQPRVEVPVNKSGTYTVDVTAVGRDERTATGTASVTVEVDSNQPTADEQTANTAGSTDATGPGFSLISAIISFSGVVFAAKRRW